MKKNRSKIRKPEVIEEFKKWQRPGWSSGYGVYRTGQIHVGVDEDRNAIYANAKSRVSLASVWEDSPVAPNEVKTRVRSVLSDWTFNPWEREGACFAGARAALLDAGFTWAEAEGLAGNLIRNAFNELGVGVERRPTWDQGQRYNTRLDMQCLHCGAHLSKDHYLSDKKFAFCSAEHASAFLTMNEIPSYAAVYNAAKRLFARERQNIAQCEVCNNAFLPDPASASKYCGYRCAGEARRSIQERTCPECDTTFRPRTDERHGKKRVYCSKACADKNRVVTARFEIKCEWCNGFFTAKTSIARFCSEAHKKEARAAAKRIQKAASEKKDVLTPEAFDFVFLVMTPAVTRLFA